MFFLIHLMTASVLGGTALSAARVACRTRPRRPAIVRSRIWRIAFVALYLALLAGPLPTLAPLAVRQAGPGTLPLPVLASGGSILQVAFETISWLLAGVWLLGVVVGSLRLAQAYAAAQSMRYWATPAAGEVTYICADIAGRLGVRRLPTILLVEDIPTPLLVGVKDPAILLPMRMFERATSAELRAVLAHELAHLKHRDLAWRALSGLARVVFFFHPIVRIAETEWLHVQELAADEQAIVVSRLGGRRYVELIVGLARRPLGLRRRIFFPGLTGGAPEAPARRDPPHTRQVCPSETGG